MKPVRKWGPGPYPVAVIHGGPGAPGEMAHVARELSGIKGVLEPFQTEKSLEGQIQELRLALSEHCQVPVTLIGFSWGAFLSWMVAARYPELVRKLILSAAHRSRSDMRHISQRPDLIGLNPVNVLKRRHS